MAQCLDRLDTYIYAYLAQPVTDSDSKRTRQPASDSGFVSCLFNATLHTYSCPLIWRFVLLWQLILRLQFN